MTVTVLQENLPALAHGRSKKWSYFSVLFSLFFFSPLFFYPNLVKQVDLGLWIAAYGVFVLCYLWGIHGSTPARLCAIPAIYAVSLLTALVNPAALFLLGFANFMLGFYWRTKWALIFCGLGLLAHGATLLSLTLDSDLVMLPSVLLSLSLSVFGLFEQREELHRQHQARSAHRMEKLSAIAERERISRDLHDLAGHGLSAIGYKAELAAKLLEKGQQESAQQQVKEVASMARELLTDIRQAVTDMKQQSIEEALTQVTHQLEARGLEVQSQIHLENLSAKQSAELAMILKELCTNITKHSQASRVEIELVVTSHKIALTVRDNGQASAIEAGNGLVGIQQRIEPYNGTLAMDTKTGVQFTIEMERA